MEKILIVDDDEICRKLIVKSLQKAGYATVEAENGRAAIELLQSEEPITLLITDIMMPGMDGFTLLTYIRNDPSLVRLPVLICTGLNSRETLIRAGHLGIAGYLLKPINVGKLRGKVREIFNTEPQPLAEMSRTLGRLDLEEDVYLEMLDMLIEKLSSGIQEIQELMVQKDYQRLSSCIMALYGAAQSLGAERIADALAGQLYASESIDFRTVQSLIDEVQRETLKLRLAVAALQEKKERSKAETSVLDDTDYNVEPKGDE